MLMKSTGERRKRSKPREHTPAEVEDAIIDARGNLKLVLATAHPRLPRGRPRDSDERMSKLSNTELWNRTVRGDVYAEAELRNRAGVALCMTMERDGRLSRAWAEWILKLLRFEPPPAKRGRGRVVNAERDYWIAGLVKMIVDKYEFPATRNRASKDSESACSIVAMACRELDMEKLRERAIEKIWSNYRERWF